jgi:membrane associated rhomboid family serine protease
MFPIRDNLPTRRFAWVTAALIAVNALAFLAELLWMAEGTLDQAIYTMGVVPYEVTHVFSLQVAASFLTSMFLHGGLMHIASNMLYLWIFGNNVEDTMGRLRFLLFYLLCGFARIDTVLLLWRFIRIVQLPASVVLGLWFVLQLLNGLLSFGLAATGGVAWFAHIGGFVVGMALGPLLRRREQMWL